MDMVFCVYDELRKVIKFSGAVNPLVYVQDGKLEILKGDIFGVGGQTKDTDMADSTFSLNTIDVSKPTTCYLFSDGFSDQFGGKNGRKFLMKNFRKLLLDIHDKPMDEQQIILKEKLAKWHGEEYTRIDDVLVMGFKI